MTLTKKHFERFAKIVQNNRFNDFMELVNELCDYFKEENPNFNKDKFIEVVIN